MAPLQAYVNPRQCRCRAPLQPLDKKEKKKKLVLSMLTLYFLQKKLESLSN